MLIFAIRIKHPLNVAVQRPHDPDPREHRRTARRRDQYQRLHSRLPFLDPVLGFRKLRDVVASVLKADKLATARQRYWIIKRSFPALGRVTRRDQRPPA
jgi:hypothetical protein